MRIRVKLCPFCSKPFKENQPVKMVGRGAMAHLSCFKANYKPPTEAEVPSK